MNNTEVIAEVRALDERFATLTRAVTDLYGVLAAKEKVDRRYRRNFWLLVGSFVLDLLLTFAVCVGLVSASDAAKEAKAATTASRTAANNLHVVCEAANEASAKQRLLWLPLAEVAPPNETPAARARRLEFLDTINHTFAPRDCGT